MFTRDGLRWQPWEDAILEEYAGRETPAVMAKAVNRADTAVRKRASRLGLCLLCHKCRKCGQPLTPGASGRNRCKPCDMAYNFKRRGNK